MIEKEIDKDILGILASKMLREGYGQVAARRDFERASKGLSVAYDRSTYNAYCRKMNELNGQVISVYDPRYPENLKELKDHPFMIFIRGDISLLDNPAITVVGTRRSSLYGSTLVVEFLSILKDHNAVVDNKIGVISGMAYGIDRKVHATSLDFDLPSVAVVAGGLDRGFPVQNSSLVELISKKGLLIAEFPPGTNIIKGMFPMRNRLMAALASAIIVVEAPVKSGALLTAKQGIDLGRDVYTFPADYFRDSSKGSNALIAEGASPLCSKFDILDMINDVR